jgi:hypothetical protein
MRSLEETIRRFGVCLKRDYGDQLARDPRAFKKRVVRFIRLALPPGPGRPLNDAVTRAIELRAQNTPWLVVYRACIQNFTVLGEGSRQLAMSRLRSAVRARRHLQKGTKPGSKFQRQEIPKHFFQIASRNPASLDSG